VRASHKQENAPGGNRPMHIVCYIQYVHLNAGNTNRGPGVSVVAVLGAIFIVGTARTRPDKYPWVTELLGPRPAKVVAVALANKMARTAWAMLVRGETYRASTRSSNTAIAAAA
jgi:hypothetical protein